MVLYWLIYQVFGKEFKVHRANCPVTRTARKLIPIWSVVSTWVHTTRIVTVCGIATTGFFTVAVNANALINASIVIAADSKRATQRT